LDVEREEDEDILGKSSPAAQRKISADTLPPSSEESNSEDNSSVKSGDSLDS